RTNVDTLDVIPVIKPIREPRLVVQTISEVDIIDDEHLELESQGPLALEP
ncbi:hypothetical protein Tco_1250117, partial [Tanacetum coccineum]